jgi:hypothetical protein
MYISEGPITDDMLANIRGCADDAATMLDLDRSNKSTADLVKAVNDFMYNWQKGKRPDIPEEDDPSLTLGSLWGEQLAREFGWEWARVIFHDHDDSQAVGVFSPDRSLAIYPFHFVYGCMENNATVTIMLAFNMLRDGAIPKMPAGSYENVMDRVHHIVPPD